MQSIELDPVPIHVELSVHWLLLSAELFVTLAWGRLIAAADAMLQNVEEITRKEMNFWKKKKYAVVIIFRERFWAGSQLQRCPHVILQLRLDWRISREPKHKRRRQWKESSQYCCNRHIIFFMRHKILGKTVISDCGVLQTLTDLALIGFWKMTHRRHRRFSE